MNNVPFHKSREIQQTFEDAGHIYIRLLSYSPFLNAAKWVFGHIKSHVRHNDLQNHQTLIGHILHDVQSVSADMVQGWIREVNRNFGKASRGKRLGESYT